MTGEAASPLQRAFTHKALFWIPLVLLLVADLATKAWATAHVKPTEFTAPDGTPFLGEWVKWKWAENEGAAFSILSGRPILLATIACIVLIAILVYMYKADRRRHMFLLGLGMISAGAIGNLYDRLLLGHVRDFIYFGVDLPFHGTKILFWTIPQRWPIWNVADAAILFGVAILLIVSFRKPPEDTPETEIPEPESLMPAEPEPRSEHGA